MLELFIDNKLIKIDPDKYWLSNIDISNRSCCSDFIKIKKIKFQVTDCGHLQVVINPNQETERLYESSSFAEIILQ